MLQCDRCHIKTIFTLHLSYVKSNFSFSAFKFDPAVNIFTFYSIVGKEANLLIVKGNNCFVKLVR